MTYIEYLKNRQSEFNELPIFYAFSESQLKKEMEKRGLTLNDKNKIRKVPGGGLILAEDMPKIIEYCKKDRDAELRNMMEKNKTFAKSAIKYEMNNVEYPINWQADYDVCSKFGHIEYSENATGKDYLKQLGFSDKIISIYEELSKKLCYA